MNPATLSTAVGKILGQIELFSLGMAISFRKRKTLNLNLLKSDLVSELSSAEGLVYIYIYIYI